MAGLAPSSVTKDLEDHFEVTLAPIGGSINTMKRRDTGLCGKYWANTVLPAKRKRNTTSDRVVAETGAAQSRKCNGNMILDERNSKEGEMDSSAVVTVSRKYKALLPSSPDEFRHQKDATPRKPSAESMVSTTSTKQMDENESSAARKESAGVESKTPRMDLDLKQVRSESSGSAADPDEIGLHSECHCASSICDCGSFNDLFLEDAPDMPATETAAKEVTKFNSLVWKKMASDDALKAPDSVQYSSAQRSSFHLLSFLGLKPYAMKGVSSTEDNGIFFVALEGTLHLYVDYRMLSLAKGDSYFVPPRVRFNIANFGSGEAVAAVMQFKNTRALEKATQTDI